MTADELIGRLHRFHMRDQATRLEFEHTRHAMAWRADGRFPLALKGAIAHRLAVCWNVLEGMPTALLEQGLLLELCQAVDAGDIDRAKAALAKMDRASDNTDGRPHDCPGCLKREVEADSAAIDEPPAFVGSVDELAAHLESTDEEASSP